MKQIYAAILIWSLLLSYPSLAQRIEAEKEFRCHSKLNSAFIYGPQKVSLFLPHNFKVTNLNSHWWVTPGFRFIRGQVTYSIIALGSNRDFYLNLDNTLNVDSIVQLKPSKQVLNFSHQADILKITHKSPESQFTIYYQGIPGESGFGGFVNEQTFDNTPALWTLSQPYGGALWWPNEAHPNRKIDSVVLAITTPSQWTVSASGMFESDTVVGDFRTATFSLKKPIAPYLIAFAVGKFTQSERVSNGLKFRYLVPDSFPGNPYWDLWDMERVVPMFERMFGAYPFPKEGYSQTIVPMSGGMEHQTNSFLGTSEYELNSHELAHQWFGDWVTCNTWQDLWFNEGYATYLQALGMEGNGSRVPEWPRGFRARLIDRVLNNPTGRVLERDTANVESLFNYDLTYVKPAMVIHQFRKRMGDSAFFSGNKALLLSYGGKNISTEQYYQFWQKRLSFSVSNFLNPWLKGWGYPKITVQPEMDVIGNKSIRIHQMGSDLRTPLHPLTFGIRIWENGQFMDTLLFMDEQLIEITHPSLSKADSITFDWHKDLPAWWKVLPEKRLSLGYSIFPNPADNWFRISSETLRPLPEKVKVFNISGCVVAELLRQPNGNFSTLSLQNGYYCLIFEHSPLRFPLVICR